MKETAADEVLRVAGMIAETQPRWAAVLREVAARSEMVDRMAGSMEKLMRQCDDGPDLREAEALLAEVARKETT